MDHANDRVAIFGGSFDPIHLGHLGMLESAMKEAELDEVIMMPCFVSPFKSGTIASGEERAKMIELSLSDLNLENVSVSRFEIEKESPSYSWETATAFSQEYPEKDWFWILGTDQWDSIENWAEPEMLRSLLSFIVVTRSGDLVRTREEWRSQSVSFSHPASSTYIRSDFEAHRDWVTHSVREFCLSRGLYNAGL